MFEELWLILPSIAFVIGFAFLYFEKKANENKYVRNWTAPNGDIHRIQLIHCEPFLITGGLSMTSMKLYFYNQGFVVIRGAAKEQHCINLRNRIRNLAKSTPQSLNNGFMDFYHDDVLAQIRQDPDMYQIFVDLLGTTKLWVVFDRVIYQGQDDPYPTLPPHVDQNPKLYPDFFGLQGLLALEDMDETTGILSLIPKSHLQFHEYAKWTKGTESYIPNQSPQLPVFLGLCVKAGDLIIWDSRTTHSRYREKGKTSEGKERFGALISFMKVPNDYEMLQKDRLQSFLDGTGKNNPAAGLRATSAPRLMETLRMDKENLTPLGEKLYGITPWDLCL
jgi:hypothetical protein